ncbi:dTDP-4-dehydrorhamnose reductase [Phreatobacter aquaticus]|uniref:dTDP-4-dehydrorhamnose reductase n=1 Tax=Phreatobacter aquaticus TaxID=2570229 RepID=A0A4D7QRR4_9HYPH|nr:dTDP-4-dehydrorhamnose reductase [Phreatobacter aquaticus]QCK88169.1 dTDP-4-dehydrorhamnose reductase [Phreatobacter aquaticus]
MRIAVTGKDGQVTRALQAAAGGAVVTVVALGRPELDLAQPDTILPALAAAAPDIIVNAAAWTAVDQAEAEPAQARAVNQTGARAVAEAAARLGVPIIQISTDYVFDGAKRSPYVETDPVGPTGAYGETKLAGEMAVAAAQPNHAILRTAWVFAPEGKNFVRAMLNLARSRPELGIVADQLGNPTYAPDIAAGIIAVARNLVADSRVDLRGVFHMTAGGETTWAGFAEAIFAGSRARGGPAAGVRPIATADYPTPARRPANSRLDCSKLEALHRVRLPSWPSGLERCLERLVPAEFSREAP